MFDLTYFQPASDPSIPVTRPDIDYAALIIDLDDEGPGRTGSPNNAIGQPTAPDAGNARRAAPPRAVPAQP